MPYYDKQPTDGPPVIAEDRYCTRTVLYRISGFFRRRRQAAVCKIIGLLVIGPVFALTGQRGAFGLKLFLLQRVFFLVLAQCCKFCECCGDPRGASETVGGATFNFK